MYVCTQSLRPDVIKSANKSCAQEIADRHLIADESPVVVVKTKKDSTPADRSTNGGRARAK